MKDLRKKEKKEREGRKKKVGGKEREGRDRARYKERKT